MHEVDAVGWLQNAKQINQQNPLNQINQQTHWFAKDQYGTFTVLQKLEDDLKKVFGLG
jgi:hypothetical protein